jgi:hypothetical protein
MSIRPLTVLLLCAASALGACAPPSAEDGVRSAEALRMPSLRQTWVADGYPGTDGRQCGNQGTQTVVANQFTKPIGMNTDGRPGGCLQSFGFIDPDNVLNGFKVTVGFHSDDPNGAGQCGSQGSQVIPVSADPSHPLMTAPIRVDTDDRPGGCREVFHVDSPQLNGVFLDLQFWGDTAGGEGQCTDAYGTPGRPGDSFPASPRSDAELRIDSDSRPGGCRQAISLRVNYLGPIDPTTR